jgi:HK97 family phage portal protein
VSVWRRRTAVEGTEARSSWVSPALTLSEVLALGRESYDAVRVGTLEDALRSIAVRSATDLFASLAAELPLDVYSGTGSDRRKRPTPGYLDDPDGAGQGREDWAYQVLVSWLMRGNMFGTVLDWDRGGVPVQVDVWHPDKVSPSLVRGRVEWSYNGRPVEDLAAFVHRRVNAVPGTVLGLSVVGYHAAQIALPLTAQRYGLQWFTDGAHPSGVLANDQVDMAALTDDQVRLIKARFMAGLRGTREPALVGKGWSFNQLQIAPEESQFLATLGASESQCARMFGPGVAEILGYESGGTLTYTNVEARMTHLLVLSLGKWLRRLERLYSWMLPRGRYVILDRDAVLESTTLARYQAHASALQNRWKTVNEVRQVESMPPVPWGDEPNSAGAGSAEGPNGSEAPDQKKET